MNYEHIGILHPSSRRGSAAPAQTYYIPKDICSCKQEGAATRLDADSENSCVCLFLHILLSPSPFIFYLFESQDDILWNNFKETEMHFEMNAMHDDRKKGSF